MVIPEPELTAFVSVTELDCTSEYASTDVWGGAIDTADPDEVAFDEQMSRKALRIQVKSRCELIIWDATIAV
jgi:hypothetical protein